jgi:uncharacterized protein YukE
MIKHIRDIKARPVIFSPSPINDGSTMANLMGGNKRLDEYSRALKELCGQEKIPYADQFHAVIDIWGKNKPDENLVNALPTLKSLAKNDNTDGVEHLRAFLAAQEKSSRKLVSMQGDPVHPGVPGQLMMAAALLKELGAEPFVSSAVIDADNLTVRSKGCTVRMGKQPEKGGLFFDRLDECLPFPIPDEAHNVLPLYPTILDMSQYTLKVTGLKGGKFQLWINSSPVAVLTGKELEAGVNLTAFGSDPKMPKIPNPIAAQGKAILAAVSARAGLVGQWRGLSKQAYDLEQKKGDSEAVKAKLAELSKTIEKADEAIREAARPKELQFTLTPME